jgi:hypothetical protein
MNKRLLLALYDRSGLGAYMPVDYKGHELVVEEHIEKFAELLLRECLVLFENAKVNEEDDVDYGLEEAKNIIKEHFEVEE